MFAGSSLPKVLEEGVVDVERSSRLQAEFKLLEHVEQLVAINELDRRNTVSHCFATGFGREGAGCKNDAFVGSPLHRTSEVPHLGGSYCTTVAFALEEDAEAHEGVDLDNAIPIETSVSGTAGDRYVLAARFPKQSLAQALESGRRQRPKGLLNNNSYKVSFAVRRDRVVPLGMDGMDVQFESLHL